jgi:hypothetical protein
VLPNGYVLGIANERFDPNEGKQQPATAEISSRLNASLGE